MLVRAVYFRHSSLWNRICFSTISETQLENFLKNTFTDVTIKPRLWKRREQMLPPSSNEGFKEDVRRKLLFLDSVNDFLTSTSFSTYASSLAEHLLKGKSK